MNREARPGIIDTLSSGYWLVYRRPWLLVLPIALDLFFWLGPRLSARPLLASLAEGLGGGSQVNRQLLDDLLVGRGDLFELLAVQLPSMVLRLDAAGLPLAANRPQWTVSEPLALAGWIGLLVLAGLLLAMCYFVPIGGVVRGERLDVAEAVRRAALAWLRVLGLIGLLLLLALAVVVPLSLLVVALSLAGINGQLFFGLLLQVGAIWLLIYLFFAVDAIIVSQAGPVRAIRNSIAVVRHNFWATLGLIVLSTVISFGLPRALGLLAPYAAGLPLAIVANAFVNTGLAAAGMIFYRDRLARSVPVRPAAPRPPGRAP